MKSKTVYIDEIGDGEYATEKAAIKAENRHRDIKDMFKFWKDEHNSKKNNNCSFSNGEYWIEHDKEFYDKVIDILDKAIRKYHKELVKEYNEDKKNGSWDKKHIRDGYVIRWMRDTDIGLYKYYCWVLNICPVCFKEWGQMFFANHCNHDGTYKSEKF